MNNLSIIIAALRGSESLEETLLSVLENRPDDCEVIVVHNGFYEDPYDLSEEVQFVEAKEATQAIDCLNLGATLATGEFLHTLESGIAVSAGWTEAALAEFEHQRVAAVSSLVQLPNDSRQVSGVGLDAAGYPCFEYADQQLSFAGAWHGAGFYQSDIFARLGGFNSSLGDLFADVDFEATCRQLELDNRIAADSLVFPSEDLQKPEINFSTAKRIQRLLARHERLKQNVSGASKWTAILKHSIFALPSTGAFSNVLAHLSSTGKNYEQLDVEALRDELESYLERVSTLPMYSHRRTETYQDRADAA